MERNPEGLAPRGCTGSPAGAHPSAAAGPAIPATDAGGPGGPGGVLSFGKSRAKLLNNQQKRITFKDVAGVEEGGEHWAEAWSQLETLRTESEGLDMDPRHALARAVSVLERAASASGRR